MNRTYRIEIKLEMIHAILTNPHLHCKMNMLYRINKIVATDYKQYYLLNWTNYWVIVNQINILINSNLYNLMNNIACNMLPQFYWLDKAYYFFQCMGKKVFTFKAE